MSIMTSYDEYNIAIYTADGGQASVADCDAVKDWLDDDFKNNLHAAGCNFSMIGTWPTMWRDMAALTEAFPHLMFEIYSVPNRDDRRQWYFSDGKVAEAEEVTHWSEYNPTEMRPIFSGGNRGN